MCITYSLKMTKLVSMSVCFPILNSQMDIINKHIWYTMIYFNTKSKNKPERQNTCFVKRRVRITIHVKKTLNGFSTNTILLDQFSLEE